MSVPGTLPADEQRRLVLQILQLVRAAYGEEAQFAITVQKVVKQAEDHLGVAVFSMGTTEKVELLATMFKIAAHSLENDRETGVRVHSIEDNQSVQ